MPTAAHKLVGIPLAEGWTATKLIPRNPAGTGGFFSVGYEATHTNGASGFVKALDYAKGFAAPGSTVTTLHIMTAAYEFERQALEACRARKMDRIALPLASGEARVTGHGYAIEQVPYLVFELAEGDVRKFLNVAARLDLTWALTCLRHVATALMQLHASGIAHQDLKPSNVLIYPGGNESRVGDLGRAARVGVAAPHDGLSIAGDRTYAPPELLYNHVDPDWNRRRVGCDVYHLGSLVCFLLGRTNMTHSIVSTLDKALHPSHWRGRYVDVLPHVRDAFDEVVRRFAKDIAPLAPKIGPEIVEIVRSLCDPDPDLRGDARHRGTPAQYSLERYISRFDNLAYKARIGLA
jgi:serine/threonine protein kinase